MSRGAGSSRGECKAIVAPLRQYINIPLLPWPSRSGCVAVGEGKLGAPGACQASL